MPGDSTTNEFTQRPRVQGKFADQATISAAKERNQVSDLQEENKRLQSIIASLNSELLDLYRRVQF